MSAEKPTQKELFTQRMNDFQPIVLAVPETYTPKTYLDEPDEPKPKKGTSSSS